MNDSPLFLNSQQLLATTFLRHLEIHEVLGSTNDRAAELAREAHVGLPALIVARRQTAGRGRGRNTWWSTEGALSFSLVVDASSTGVVPANWPQLSLATAVAVCDALVVEFTPCGPTLETVPEPSSSEALPQPSSSEALPQPSSSEALPQPSSSETLPQPSPSGRGQGEGSTNARPNPNRQPYLGIKWPNDVLIDGGKVCGILLESPGSSDSDAKRLIVGIGINVNNSWSSAPAELRARGTALCDVTGRQHDLQSLLVRLLKAWSLRSGQWLAGDPGLARDWQRLNLLADKQVVVEHAGRTIRGRCGQIDHDGSLLVETVNGRHRLYSGSPRLADEVLDASGPSSQPSQH